MAKLSETIDNIVDTGSRIIGLILGTGPGLITTGTFIKGVGNTIANPNVASAVVKTGEFVKSAGTAVSRYVGAGLKAVAKTSATGVVTGAKTVATGAKAVGKTLPLSKYIAPVMKYVPHIAAAYLSTAGAIKAVKSLGQIKSVRAGILDKDFATASSKLSKIDLTDPNWWANLGKEILTFK